jgi:acetyl-CoA acetyltransferase
VSGEVAIVGIGRTAFSRDKVSPRTPMGLATEAIRAAILDAGLTPGDIDGMGSFSMNDSVTFGQAAHALGIQDLRWNLDVYAGGFGSYVSVQAAASALRSGECTYAVVYRSLCGRSGLRYGDGDAMATLASHVDQEFDYPSGYVIPPQWFAMWAARHQHEYGTTEDDLGAIAINTRAHAVDNAFAMMRSPMTMDDYRASPMVSTPLRIVDCSLEVDGACAVVMTTLDRARDCAHPPVVIRAGEGSFNAGVSFNDWPDFTQMFSHRIADRFWAMAGIGPSDVDVACIYDCFTYTVMTVMEGMGFFKPGEGGDFFRDGRATYGGDVVVNPHGGLLSEGYIHGFNHHLEAVTQLRGDAGSRQVADCRTVLVTGGGGPSGGAFLYTRDVDA